MTTIVQRQAGGSAAAAMVLISAGIATHGFNELSISASLPVALADLGGLHLLPLIAACFAIGTVAGGLAGAQLRALFGARRLAVAASLLFLLGGLIAATAATPEALLAGRALQGLSEGVTVALCYGLIPELFRTAAISKVFAVESIIWAVAAMLGPLCGGLATELVSWRLALLVSAPLSALFLVLALVLLTPSRGAPARRLSALLAPALCLAGAAVIALASILPGWTGLTLPLGLAIAVFAFWIDRRAGARFFTDGAFGLGPVGRGTWLLFLMPIGHAAQIVFLAYLVGTLWGLSTVWVGWIMITTSLSWSLSAYVLSRLRSVAVQQAALRHGALAQAAGAACLAAGLSLHILALVIVGQVFAGLGFGMTWGFGNQAIMVAVPEAERSRTSSFMPTLQTAGFAIGAGVMGIIGAATGLIERAQAGAPGPAVLALWAMTGAVALLAWAAGRRLELGEAGP